MPFWAHVTTDQKDKRREKGRQTRPQMIAANPELLTFPQFAVFCGSRAKTPKQLAKFTSRLAKSGKVRVFEISSRFKRISYLEALKFRERQTTPEKTFGKKQGKQ